ncbi:MAG: choice-of-anchor tandem repeat GloVer-containing protein [Ferruginibacter sp.]
MKKGYLVFIICLVYISAASAQGIYQLWGATKDGGDDKFGAMFSTTATGNNFQERHQFNIANPGAYPQLTNLVEFNGKLYGMTQQGGLNSSGIIFEWNPATNQYTKKKSFSGPDGSGPLGSLVFYGGKFYGMTENGGDQAQGVIFEWDPLSNVYTKKIDFTDNPFDGYNGYRPAGNLTMKDGRFYGMTAYGGNDDKGVIFEWDPVTNVYTKKKDLNGNNGSRPFGSLTLSDGKFYGMTTFGGSNDKGVIFEWDPATNNYSKKKDFDGSNGSYPYGNLTPKGTGFIGMTQHGGQFDNGVIFEWDLAANNCSTKYDFGDSNGYWPGGDLTLKDGKYYGTAFRGGDNDAGVIFEWNPAMNQYTKLVDLGSYNGKYPQTGLALYNGKFYGMTSQGGNGGKGVIFEWEQTGNVYTKKIDLNDISNGINPTGNVKQVKGKFYGMTNLGGSNNAGVIFEWDQSTSAYTKKIDLNNTDGSKPTGSLTLNAGKFYGMTKNGGNTDEGTIFEWDPATNTYTKKIDLAFDSGAFPQGSLVLSGGKLYGMTTTGGVNGSGVIFEWDPATNIYSDKIDLIMADGSKPYGDLAAYNGKFYGMTNRGGINNSGVIFEWDPVANAYAKKFDLSTTSGKLPYGSLTLYGSKFYGMTSSGGTNNKGVIFEWDPTTNAYTKKFEFSNTDTYSPLGGLTMSSGGKFYGMTNLGGSNNAGVIFEWEPVSNIFTKKQDLSGYISGTLPGIITDISLAPAPVAKGMPNNCVSFPVVTIDNTNNNVWVPIMDDLGDAVAEIKANGNNLGMVNASMYINSGTVREDGTSDNRLYLDRNITITPEFPVANGSSVDIRLYIRNAEYQALKNAVNSAGHPSGVSSINDIGIYKNSDPCSPAVGFIANPVATANDTWGADYVLSANISSFSSFYFANIAQGGPLPLTNLEFNGRLVNNDGIISWKTINEFNSKSFELERSSDGTVYTVIDKVDAINQPGLHQYNYIDKNVVALKVPVIFYRLKQIDIDNRFAYSKIVVLNIKSSNTAVLYPNPVTDNANLLINIYKPEQVQERIIDNAGRIVQQQQMNLPAGSISVSIDVSNLAGGIYYLELKGETMNEHKQFIKQ